MPRNAQIREEVTGLAGVAKAIQLPYTTNYFSFKGAICKIPPKNCYTIMIPTDTSGQTV